MDFETMKSLIELIDESNVSSAQRSILHCFRMLAPFEEVDIRIKDTLSQRDIHAAEEEFYHFISELYMDMYISPEKYYIPTAAYDEYKKTAKQKSGVEKMHYVDGKECNLRNTFQQAIQFYPKFFYELGLQAEAISDADFALVIMKDKLDTVKKSLEMTHLRKDNSYRYEVIASLGIEMKQVGDQYYILNRNFPKMFLGLCILCKAPESKYKYMNYLRLDYKGFHRAMPDMEAIKMTLSKDHSRIINSVQTAMDSMKLKIKVKPLRNITSGSRWKVEYLLHSKNVFGFYAEPDYLMLCIYFNDVKNINELSTRLESLDTELFQWFSSKFPERLCKCPSNRWATFGASRRRICGLSCRAEVVNPEDADVINSIRVLKLFRA